ncbi:MAG TPA: flagellin [Terracidiphilus sp.]|nr:flagellin [Terracidiphilus sp.]
MQESPKKVKHPQQIGGGLGTAKSIRKGVQPMALGVLNNLSAIYAENNLNNTNNSLQTVLQQLSSGSRINSGADDAAGLSLVNGLAANSSALTQSETNATEGVGLLQVADGALSQVTALLNRAITLATEASNGTLDASQEAAANQEYQSILSEINNIGSTTTYNQNQVFTGSQTGLSIYTGDSSSTGASIDNLYFAKLTSSSVGDAGGTVQQSSAGKFIDLSKDTAGSLTTAAQQSDAVAGGLVFTITNPDGTTSTLTTTATTVGALISEINQDGIPGVTASFTTAAAVGDGAVAGGDTGILLTNTNSNVAIALTAAPAFGDTTTAITPAGLVASTNATTTINYVTATGGDQTADLSNTNLTTQGNAQNALSVLNLAITYVAAQDGYLGAQINTLNAISQVMSTQQENVVSAQNAVQATDYAAATSNMSKYEILSQTGIAALAQANSVQQEVTKLLQ